jgi:hypothetical protein
LSNNGLGKTAIEDQDGPHSIQHAKQIVQILRCE